MAWGRAADWLPVANAAHALWGVPRIVTAFTLAHAMMLTLATLGVVSLLARAVEATIAASLVLAAFNNVFPLFTERRWTVAFGFGFGLVHGFGFARVLARPLRRWPACGLPSAPST